ncbi:hypothetical protein ACFLXH_02535 [Chloroflexota bacterium]
MKVKKTYQEINPELLYAEIKDFALKQGVNLGESTLETYTMPDQSASFIARGNLIFLVGNEDGKGKECLRAHIVGSVRGETKLMLDIEEKVFPGEKIKALQDDIDFIFGAYELTS